MCFTAQHPTAAISADAVCSTATYVWVTSARQTRAFSSFDATSSNGSPRLSKIQYMLINKRQRVSELYNGFCRLAYIVKYEG
jgi:hypothetical protein